jgi:hypothetical protein
MVMNPSATQKYFNVLDNMNKEGRGEISSLNGDRDEYPWNIKEWREQFNKIQSDTIKYHPNEFFEKMSRTAWDVMTIGGSLVGAYYVPEFAPEFIHLGYELSERYNDEIFKSNNQYMNKEKNKKKKTEEGQITAPGGSTPGICRQGIQLYSKGGYTGTTGGIVHPHEMVMNPAATQKYFNTLEKMNNEGSAAIFSGLNSGLAANNTIQQGDIHIFVNAAHGINVEVGSPDPRVIVG